MKVPAWTSTWFVVSNTIPFGMIVVAGLVIVVYAIVTQRFKTLLTPSAQWTPLSLGGLR